MKERKAKLRQKAEDEVLTPYWTVSFGIPITNSPFCLETSKVSS